MSGHKGGANVEKTLKDIGVKISDKGEIWELHENGTIYREVKIYILEIRGSRYPLFTLSKNGVQTNYYAHRVIAENFIPNPENYKYVKIINGNPYDFSVENLKWMSKEERALEASKTREENKVVCSICGTKHHKDSQCKECKKRKIKTEKAQKKRHENKRFAKRRIGHVDLELLKPKYRAVAMAYLNGLSISEIARKDHTTRSNISLYLQSIEQEKEKIFEKKFNFIDEEREE